jgi:uncharacterized membrane protein
MSRDRQTLPFRFAGTLVAVAAAAATLAVSNPASAQEDCYHIIDLGEIGFTPGIEDISGINNANQAVFTAMVSGKKHAMLYLPVGAYDLAAGVHDLHVLAGAAITGDESAAHDINEAGIVVGWAEIQGEQRAFVWRLDIDPFLFIDLDTFSAGDSSTAFAINNDTPFPIVVGDGNLDGDCGCDPEIFDDVIRRAFALELEDPPVQLDQAALLLQDPNLGSCQSNTWGRDVKSLAALTVAGFSTFHGEDCAAPFGCGARNAGTAWIDPAQGSNEEGVALAFLPPTHHEDFGGTQSRGVSDTGAMVGYGYTAASSTCKQHAVYWDTDTVLVPVDLGEATGIDASSQSLAVRINNNESPETLQAVGWQLASPDRAFLWECDGVCNLLANWSATDLNDTIQHCSDFWLIRQAHDINDDGWIIGWADANEHGPADFRAVILFPEQDCEVCCFADLDCDGNVGVPDLLILLGSWGPCPAPPAPCDADLDCDGVVGVKDLLLLLAAWNTCEMTAPSEIPKTVQDCYNKFYPQDMEALLACIETLSG